MMEAYRQAWLDDEPGLVPSRVARVASAAPTASIHIRLKLATRLDHNRVDRSLTNFDLTRAEDYAAFLRVNAAALGSLRPHWRKFDRTDFGALIDAATVDLAVLGVDQQNAPRAVGPIDGLGLAYVVRGSRLGSKILRKRVQRGFPTAYLDFRPAVSWHGLLLQLEEREAAEPESDHAIIAGARATFAVYQQVARCERAAA